MIIANPDIWSSVDCHLHIGDVGCEGNVHWVGRFPWLLRLTWRSCSSSRHVTWLFKKAKHTHNFIWLVVWNIFYFPIYWMYVYTCISKWPRIPPFQQFQEFLSIWSGQPSKIVLGLDELQVFVPMSRSFLIHSVDSNRIWKWPRWPRYCPRKRISCIIRIYSVKIPKILCVIIPIYFHIYIYIYIQYIPHI